ncbi:Pycsar system effector family protein [Sphingobacterium zeae]|uniref:Metal-dependent HD superfamily phosphohydrolase n=1 Tax=Sphingobacterium zeae TaxID=1776859 RepID=A0ABU0U0C6_9SPHI|nr:Pycsar system effector family protein [Sphingobacterium zeae]MDQ1148416.1 putative metal-dependent HD superfamily phosphohydrolase [Sphingobacterium zeae]
MIDYAQLLKQVEEYAENYITENISVCHCFHNTIHTRSVVSSAEEILLNYQLGEEDHFIVISAAYFHDLGYVQSNNAIGHEKRSVEIALEFLREKGIPQGIQEKIKGCILATRMPQDPTNLLEQILCDADLFHFGSDDFVTRNKLMKAEAEAVLGKEIDKDVWRAGTIKLLMSHHYHTEYAQQKLNAKKEMNLKELEKKQEKSIKKNKENKKEDKKDKEKSGKPERGIETMFRITSSNNQRLSDMADNKANILLTVNSIILSVVIAVLFRKLDANEHLIIPTIILTTAVVATMVMAILSTIPKIPSGKFSKDEIQQKSVNLLFFGNFYKMKLDDYNEGMQKVMVDSEFLYGMLTKDVYSQGVVLGRKYKLLRYAYGVFMFGLVISVVSFIGATLF